VTTLRRWSDDTAVLDIMPEAVCRAEGAHDIMPEAAHA
jgi:hypothetical protein